MWSGLCRVCMMIHVSVGDHGSLLRVIIQRANYRTYPATPDEPYTLLFCGVRTFQRRCQAKGFDEDCRHLRHATQVAVESSGRLTNRRELCCRSRCMLTAGGRRVIAWKSEGDQTFLSGRWRITRWERPLRRLIQYSCYSSRQLFECMQRFRRPASLIARA